MRWETARDPEDPQSHLVPVLAIVRVKVLFLVPHEPLAPLWVARLCRAKYCNCILYTVPILYYTAIYPLPPVQPCMQVEGCSEQRHGPLRCV